MNIDFDSNDWMAQLGEALRCSVPESARLSLPSASVTYYEEALDALIDDASLSQVVDDVLDWIRANSLQVYHGTRLTDEEARLLKRDGLRPLSIGDRIGWLRSTFPDLRDTLTEAVVTAAMHKGQLRHRENQVHAAILRAEMLRGYDYLFEGSEFDRRLLQFGGHPELVNVLRSRGESRLVRLVIPGDEALDAMHPFFPIDWVRAQDGYPNLVRELLRAWAYEIHRPGEPRFGVDACLMFRKALPGAYVEDVELVLETGRSQDA
ncbi:hypothetical protein [Mesorhizobium carmichaelinearum]|uniref:hypothetical protein n=1 Tax=Mesorhizobium carmichaelinearum TaxID=1208188 RepID=UPI000BA367E1|nr:hypothetical protein [Mesorhizobium carmichaelinearum]